jgi:hypothetical protein
MKRNIDNPAKLNSKYHNQTGDTIAPAKTGKVFAGICLERLPEYRFGRRAANHETGRLTRNTTVAIAVLAVIVRRCAGIPPADRAMQKERGSAEHEMDPLCNPRVSAHEHLRHGPCGVELCHRFV